MKLYTTDGNFIKETDDYPTNYTGMIEDQSGNKRWYVEGISHRDNDLPAVIYKNGNQCWYVGGKLHREGNPAEILVANGVFANAPALNTKRWYWYNNGQSHRLDGPAIEYEDGSKYWFVNGKRHRIDGPAFECTDGSKVWFVNGKMHRIDGPAVVFDGARKASDRYKLPIRVSRDEQMSYTEKDIKVRSDGTKAVELWFVDDKKVTEEACKLLGDMLKLKSNKNGKIK